MSGLIAAHFTALAPHPHSSLRSTSRNLIVLALATVGCIALSSGARAEEAASQTLSATTSDSASVVKVADQAPVSTSAESAKPVFGTIGSSAQSTAAATTTNPYRLRKALRERGLSLGYGQKIPFDRFDKRTDTTMYQLIPAKGRFRNSTQEFIWEAPLVVFTEPHTDFLAGVTLLFRQHLTSNRRFAPYLEIGAGANLTNLDIPEIGGRFQFSAQGGAGIRAAVGRNSDLTVGARWYHLSNGGLKRPNTGLNDYLITIGYSHLM